MDTSLSALSKNSSIPFHSFLETEVSKSDLERCIPIAVQFCRNYRCVLYGGQTASPYVYGYKTLRSATTDLDFICTIDGAREIVRNEPELFYHPDYDILFCYRSHIPVTFTVAHIHDCLAGPEVITTAEAVITDAGPLLCANREYSIVLKMRRSEDCLLHRRSIFGKDALDIINIVARAAADRRPMDYGLVSKLFRAHVTGDRSEALEICAEITLYESHLPSQDRTLFLDEWGKIVNAVTEGLS